MEKQDLELQNYKSKKENIFFVVRCVNILHADVQ